MNTHFLFHQLSNKLPLMDNIFPSKKSFPTYCRASAYFYKGFHFPSYRQIGPKLAEALLAPETPPNSMGQR
jgi:hypothetical protein